MGDVGRVSRDGRSHLRTSVTTDTRILVATRSRMAWVPLLGAACLVFLAVGLTSPLMHVERLLPPAESYSVLSGSLEFLRTGRWHLGALVLLFSAVFPVVKLLLLIGTWMWPMSSGQRRAVVAWLDRLGKWSMLDVYVALFTVGAVQLGMLADAEIRWGLYAFGAAILLSMVASQVTLRVTGARQDRELEPPERTVGHLPLVTGIGLPLLAGGMALPVLEVEKWILWGESFSIIGGVADLLTQGRPVLGVGFALLVIVGPLLYQTALFLLSADHVSGATSPRLRAVLRGIEEWAMADVFGLALFVGGLGLAGLADVRPRAGLWLFAGGLFCSAYGTFWIRRLYT